MLNQLLTRRAWNPAHLFLHGEKGAWYDPSDLTTTFTDTAGTTPANTNGAVVARINDKSGNGNHAILIGGQTGCTLVIGGGLTALQDNAGNSGYLAAACGMTGAVATACFGHLNNNGNNSYVFSVDSDTVDSTFSGGINATFVSNVTATGHYGPTDGYYATITCSNPETVVVTAINDFGGASGPVSIDMRKNASATGLTYTGAFGAVAALFAPARNIAFMCADQNSGGAYRPAYGNCYGCIIVNRRLQAAELAALETYMGNKSGISI